MQLQSIFAHLLDGRLQFHTPQGFWKDFRHVSTLIAIAVHVHVYTCNVCMYIVKYMYNASMTFITLCTFYVHNGFLGVMITCTCRDLLLVR